MIRVRICVGSIEYEPVNDDRLRSNPELIFQIAAVEVVAVEGRRAWLNTRLVTAIYIEDDEFLNDNESEAIA